MSIAEERTWAQAPEFDEEHPDELSYRPFPLAPLLTDSPSSDDPALASMVHPDAARTLDMIDDEGRILPLRFRQGEQFARLGQIAAGRCVQPGQRFSTPGRQFQCKTGQFHLFHFWPARYFQALALRP